MQQIATALAFQLPINRRGLRDLAFITTIYRSDDYMPFGRVDAFYVPALGSGRDDFVLKQYHGNGIKDISWPLDVLKETMLMEWRNRQLADGGIPSAEGDFTLDKLGDDGNARVKAQVANGLFPGLDGVKRMSDVPGLYLILDALLQGALPGEIQTLHPRSQAS